MELFVRSRIILHQVTWLELLTILLRESHHHVSIVSYTNLVKVSERTATEGSETCAEHKANVTHDWVGNDFVLQAFDSFIDKSVL